MVAVVAAASSAEASDGLIDLTAAHQATHAAGRAPSRWSSSRPVACLGPQQGSAAASPPRGSHVPHVGCSATPRRSATGPKLRGRAGSGGLPRLAASPVPRFVQLQSPVAVNDGIEGSKGSASACCAPESPRPRACRRATQPSDYSSGSASGTLYLHSDSFTSNWWREFQAHSTWQCMGGEMHQAIKQTLNTQHD